MPATRLFFAGALASVASLSYACPLPPLVPIPPKEQAAAVEADVRAATAKYVEDIKAFTACVQAELAAAGGETAPPVLRSTLIRRHNAAVAEAEAVLELFAANVGAGQALPAPN